LTWLKRRRRAHGGAHLQRGAAGPVAVGEQLVLTGRRAELLQLLLLQLSGGEAEQQLEEGAPGNGRYVQVLLHQVAHRARLRQAQQGHCREAGEEDFWIHIPNFINSRLVTSALGLLDCGKTL